MHTPLAPGSWLLRMILRANLCGALLAAWPAFGAPPAAWGGLGASHGRRGAVRLQWRSPSSTRWVDVAGPLFVLTHTRVAFRAIRADGRPFPKGEPVWRGAARGAGPIVMARFGSPCASRKRPRTVDASWSGGSVRAEVVVFDLIPDMMPADNFPGRDMDTYGIGEVVYLSYRTVPPGITPEEMGGLDVYEDACTTSQDDVLGAANGLGTLTVGDVPKGATTSRIVLAWRIRSGPCKGMVKRL